MKDIRKILMKIFQIFLDFLILIFLLKNMLLKNFLLKKININRRKNTNWSEPYQKRENKYNLIGKLIRLEKIFLIFLLKLYSTNISTQKYRKNLLDFKYEMF